MTGSASSLKRPGWLDDESLFPSISFVIPMYNEQAHIANCLSSILAQNYPAGKLQIVVIDGNSTDASVRLVKDLFGGLDTPVSLITNPLRKTARSLNMGLAEANGDVIVILGAHAEIEAGFIRHNLENLRSRPVVCSGGTLTNGGSGRTQRSIGEAMSHPFGMAAATHRYRTKPGLARTAVFGAYRREIFDIVGDFEEQGEMAEDAELNWRIVDAGYGIWYDPRIKSVYHPRQNLSSLARQLYTYGSLRAQMVRKHPGGLSMLHYAPPLSLLALLTLSIASLAAPSWLVPLALLTGLYATLALLFSLQLWATRRRVNPLVIGVGFAVIHVGWGLGFLIGLTRRKVNYDLAAGKAAQA
ncbi:MAG: glycosyltransferase family 2 protein [Candidatus Marinimicrobia bacterium]|nr:glycosyltransferase family 2 protein [Candidatus Neomarinimicrobiota bacterium]